MAGTKTEMERLLAKATEITGVKYDISNLNDVFQAIHVIQGELGITGTTAKEAEETISGSVNAMKASWDNFLNGSGTFDQFVESAKTAFNNIFKAAKKIIPRIMKEVIDALPTQLVKTLKVLTPILIAVGTALGVIWGYLKAVSIIKAVQKAFATLNVIMAANPIVLIIAAIAALVAAFIYLWKNCEAFRDFWIGLWENLRNIVSKVVDFFKNNWQGILLFLVNPFAGGFKLLYDNCEVFRNFINNIISQIKQFFIDLWENIKNGAQTAWNKVKEAWNTVSGWFYGKIISPINNFFDGMWNRLRNGASNAVNGIKNVIGSVWDSIRSKTQNIWNGIKDTISNTITAAKDTVSNAINTIKDIARKIFDGIKPKLNLSIPKVTVSGGEAPFGIAGKGKLPSFHVNWNASGGVFEEPTIFATSKGFQGVGEKGAEAIVPLHQNKKWIKAVAEDMRRAIIMENGIISSNASIKANNSLNNTINAKFDIDGSVELDGKRVGRVIAPYTMQTIKVGGGNR